MNEYAGRLGPFIAEWRRRGTRVAIFGIGPHTDHLFEQVPALESVAIVGYLDGRKDAQGTRYRGRRVFPPSWAADHADVVLCSSFVSEPRMAAAVESLPCKILMSHTRPDEAARETRREGVVFRPDPIGRLLEWPGDEADAQSASAPLSYLRHSRVLDAIIEQVYPFCDPGAIQEARALVRYATPGMDAWQLGASAPSLTALLVLAAGPGGRVTTVAPAYGLSEVIDLLDRHGRDWPARLRTTRWDADRAGASPAHPLLQVIGMPGIGRRTAVPTGPRVAKLVVSASKRRTGDMLIHVADPSQAAGFIRQARTLLERCRPALVLRLGGTPAATVAAAEVFGVLKDVGYKWSVEAGQLAAAAERRETFSSSPALVVAVSVRSS